MTEIELEKEWVCIHSPSCRELGSECKPPSEYDFLYEIGYFTEGEVDVDSVRSFAASMAARAYREGFEEGKKQAQK